MLIYFDVVIVPLSFIFVRIQIFENVSLLCQIGFHKEKQCQLKNINLLNNMLVFITILILIFQCDRLQESEKNNLPTSYTKEEIHIE